MTRLAGSLCGGDESSVHPESQRLTCTVGGGLHEGSFVGAGADAQDLGAGYSCGGWSAGGSFHVVENIRPRNPLTTMGITGHNIATRNSRPAHSRTHLPRKGSP